MTRQANAKVILEATPPHDAETTEDKGQPHKLRSNKQAFELSELTDQGYGSRAFLYLEIGCGRLVARKRGRRTIVLAHDLSNWLSNLPKAKISPPKPKADQGQPSRPTKITDGHARVRCGAATREGKIS